MGNECSCGRQRERTKDGQVPSPYNVLEVGARAPLQGQAPGPLQQQHQQQQPPQQHQHKYEQHLYVHHQQLNGGGAAGYSPLDGGAGSHLLQGPLPDGYGPLPAGSTATGSVRSSSVSSASAYPAGYGPMPTAPAGDGEHPAYAGGYGPLGGGERARHGSVDSFYDAHSDLGPPRRHSKVVTHSLTDEEGFSGDDDDDDENQSWAYPVAHNPAARGGRAMSADLFGEEEAAAAEALGPVAHNPPAQFKPLRTTGTRRTPVARYLSHTMSSMRKSKRASVAAVAKHRASAIRSRSSSPRKRSASPRKRGGGASPRKGGGGTSPRKARPTAGGGGSTPGGPHSSRVDEFLANKSGVW